MKLKKLMLTGLIAALMPAAYATQVTLKVGGFAPGITLESADNGRQVDVGEGDQTNVNKPHQGVGIWTFDAPAGEYILTGYDNADLSQGNLFGKVQFTIPEGETAEITIPTHRVGQTTQNDDGSWFVPGEDFTVDWNDFGVETQQGAKRNVTLGTTILPDGVWAVCFMMVNGDTFYGKFTPAAKWAEKYFPVEFRILETQNTNENYWKSFSPIRYYTIRVPKNAELFAGKKSSHYVPFSAVEPMTVEDDPDDADLKRYIFKLASGTYNYKVRLDGAITHAGKFCPIEGMPDGDGFTLTRQTMLSRGATKLFDHDATHNSGANNCDIYLNINKQGHLKLAAGDKFQIEPQRVWQITDDDSNNYYVNPDYHVSVYNTDFTPAESVVSSTGAEMIEAKTPGTAIVMVDYDALYAWQYNKQDGFYDSGSQAFWYGTTWGSLWAENMGLFVVSVGAKEDSALKPNFLLGRDFAQTGVNYGERTDFTLDSEFDVLYYMAGEPGYRYRFTPEGAASVEVANPTIDDENNTVSYAGFSADNVIKNEDGSFEVLLTRGRNIIRVNGLGGGEAYQVVSAKPMGYTVTNLTRPGIEAFYPGDQVNVQFSGLCPVVNKLAGIYNHSTYIGYNGLLNGKGAILGPNQYRFGGMPEAQSFIISIPIDATDVYTMTDGCLQKSGYGDLAGNHRGIDRTIGRNPNFTAKAGNEYFSSLPDVEIPIQQFDCFFLVKNLAEGTTFNLTDSNDNEILPDGENRYKCAPGRYFVSAMKEGHRPIREWIELSIDDLGKVIDAALRPLEGSEWDGFASTEPALVSDEESATAGGEFEGLAGYYKVTTGGELHYALNTGKKPVVLLNDIDLCNAPWTTAQANSIEGKNHEITGIFVRSTSYAAFMFQAAASHSIRNLTIHCDIKGISNWVGGLLCKSAGKPKFSNIHVYGSVSGPSKSVQYVGGLVGLPMMPPTIENCSFHGTLSGMGSYMGGIAGQLSSLQPTLTNCYVSGSVTYTGDIINPTIGAFVGRSSSKLSLTNCYTTATVSNKKLLGGDNGTITNCYALEGTLEDNLATEMPAESFANGEVAWSLGSPFGQKIGVDSYPWTGGEKVYRVDYTTSIDAAETMATDSGDAETTLYTNANLPEMSTETHTARWYTDASMTSEVHRVESDCHLHLAYTQISGVEDIDADTSDAPAEWYNLQGIRVDNPGRGVYIRRQGNRVEKIMID